MKLSKSQLFEILQNPVLWKSNDILANCPICNKREFYVSLNDNHPFQCVRKKKCGWSGNVYTLLRHLGILDEYTIAEPIKINQMLPDLFEDSKDQQSLDIELNEVKLPLGFKRVYYDSYLESRGFTKDDYNTYHVGITNLDRKLINYIIFIVKQDFKNVATIGRYKGSKEECDLKKLPRYKNSNSDFSKILGNYDEIEKGVTETVILVEGFFDCKNVSDLLDLKSNDLIKCCYTFKCHASDEQIYRLQLKEVKKVLVLYDSDVLSKIKDVALKLANYFDVQVGYIECINEDSNIKDPGELNLEELQEVLKNTSSPLNFSLKKVSLLNL